VKSELEFEWRSATRWKKIAEANRRHPLHSGAGAPRHDQRRRFYVDIVLDSRYVEMDVVRGREGCLNGSEVEGSMKKV
jgi:hypothetical protein